MLARSLIWLVLAAGCTHAQLSRVRLAGEITALTGVAGVIASVLATAATEQAKPFVAGFSVVTGVGIVSYAIAELEDTGPAPETIEQRNRRWAKILTQRAAGAARDGNCARVRRLEVRVRTYDPEVHDFVFLRDPEIARCLSSP